MTSDPRQARIEAHKRKKALEENLKKFETEQKEDSVDEELERKYWLENIELYEGTPHFLFSTTNFFLKIKRIRVWNH